MERQKKGAHISWKNFKMIYECLKETSVGKVIDVREDINH